MPIVALSEETARIITSSLALHHADNVVKELVDNALDAGASSIAAEISFNTLDAIQVKDNGKGIGIEDRQLLCKKGCTSKIRSIDDLAQLGGKSLGFRGEALASIANVSGSVIVTTKIEGEVVGSALKFAPDGKMISSSSASHPVGTTIRVQNFLVSIPVRKQTALKTSSRILTNLRKLLLAYAFARPEVRFSLKVLKAKSDKDNWNYAPVSSPSNLLDAAQKIVGKDIAAQVAFHSTTDGDSSDQPYYVEALLISANADVQKACSSEQYISVDRRPVNPNCDPLRDLLKVYKKYLRAATSTDESQSFSKPFISVRIICPPESYDVNVEPSKDRILFYKPSTIISLFEKLLASVYGEPGNTTIATASTASKASLDTNPFDLLLAQSRPKEVLQSSQTVDYTAGTLVTADAEAGPPPNGGDPEAGVHETAQGAFDNPWTKVAMNVRLSAPMSHPQNSHTSPIENSIDFNDSHQAQSADHTTASTPNRRPLGFFEQLPTPIESPHSPQSSYQNPGPPLRRHGPRETGSEEPSPPPSVAQQPTLLEGWIESTRNALPDRNDTSILPSSPLAATSTIARSDRPLPAVQRRSLGLSKKAPHRSLPQTPFMSPFKRPNLSQGGPSDGPDTHPLSSSVRRDVPPVRLDFHAQQERDSAERELDEILDFERQKRDVVQRRKAAEKIMQRQQRFHDESLASSETRRNAIDDLAPDVDRESGISSQAQQYSTRFGAIASISPVREPNAGTTDNMISNPHQNRARTAVRRLGADKKQTTPATAQLLHPIDLGEHLTIPDIDPRACLIRQKTLKHEQKVSEASGLTRTGLKIRRTKTSRLPFETIPPGQEVHSLSVALHGKAEGSAAFTALRKAELAHMRNVDEYIISGQIQPLAWTVTGRDVERWQKTLTNFVQRQYRPRDDGTDEGVAEFVFNVELSKALKAHTDDSTPAA